MARITISYRRDDSGVITGRMFDRLTMQFGRESVFRDIDNIPPGADFRRHIEAVLDESDVVLAVIGPRWVGARAGKSRLASPTDPVRVEIETALRKDKPLIPVLVLDADMPPVEQLPASLQDLAYRHAVSVDAGQDFDVHMARLIRAIDRMIEVEVGHDAIAGRQAAAVDAAAQRAARSSRAPPRSPPSLAAAADADTIAPRSRKARAKTDPVGAKVQPPRPLPTAASRRRSGEKGRPLAERLAATRDQPADYELRVGALTETIRRKDAQILDLRKALTEARADLSSANAIIREQQAQLVALTPISAPAQIELAPTPGATLLAHEANERAQEAHKRGDFAAAIRWYETASQMGDTDAQYWLGKMYEDGNGTARDLEKARHWYRQAADGGEAAAQNALVRLDRK